MTYSRKCTRMYALIEELGEEEGYDGLEWVCVRIARGDKWRSIEQELKPWIDARKIGITQPREMIRRWVNTDPDRKKRFREARISSGYWAIDRAEGILFGTDEKPINPKTLTNQEMTLINNQVKFLERQAARADPDTYSDKQQVQTNVTINMGELHMEALMKAGGFSSLKAPEEPKQIESDAVEEADYEIVVDQPEEQQQTG